MESEQRGRASRASSTSSLGREVRCGCQYYQSDSLLPERRALLGGRPSSRTMQQPPAVRCSEHEYEPIAAPSPSPKPATAPVVRITDTDVMPVADSDDSIDDRTRLPPELTQDGDVVLPLDGKIEDSAMEGRELVETGDTSEEQETPQQLQERLEERFLNTATPGTESRTDGEINTSQVDSLALEELPLQRGARGIPQRIKTQAGKLRSRIRGFQRPTFNFPKRQKVEKAKTEKAKSEKTKSEKAKPEKTKSEKIKSEKAKSEKVKSEKMKSEKVEAEKTKSEKAKSEKTKSTSSGRSEKSRSETRPSRMERIRSSLPDRPKFNLPSRPKFNLPDRSKFHLPERPKFNLPERPKFHLPERPKFNIKKPNIRLPNALTRSKKPSSPPDEPQQPSTDSTVGSRTKHFFDFSTYPRIFDRKSKHREGYATSTPKDSRAQSAESATFPRTRKAAANARWTQRFDDAAFIDEDRPDSASTVERSHPWRHPSMEEPRLSIRMEEEVLVATGMIPWEERRQREQEELQYMDYEQESPETSDRHGLPTSQEASRTEEESYDRDRMRLDPRLYGDQGVKQAYPRIRKEKAIDEREPVDWEAEERMMMAEREFMPIQRSRSLGEEVSHVREERYDGSFAPVDPRQFGPPKSPSEEEEYEEEMEDADEEQEPSSAQSDREQQQSSGSSCDRRRRGVIEEIDSDEFFLREGGLSQDDMNLGKYLAHEIRDALRTDVKNALTDDSMMPMPPQRPERKRSLRKRKEGSVESYEVEPPVRPKREQAGTRRSMESGEEDFRERTRSDSRHRVVYQAEREAQEFTPPEPLDDIVVVKPMRRKSKSIQRGQSQASTDSSVPPAPRPRSPTTSPLPPTVPSRRKRSRGESLEGRNGDASSICNGHPEWAGTDSAPRKPLPLLSKAPKGILDDREVLTAEDIMATSQEDIRNLATRLRGENFVEAAPIPPKRRSRSRGTSVAQDEDRTSHGAESLPEAGYIEEDLPRDDIDSARDLSGYAIVDKREKPPRPPPPRRKRDKFATTPRPGTPKRPQRAYSTLGPAKSRDTSILSESITTLEPGESTPYIEIDSDDTEHKDLRSGEVLSKMQGRPLPAPPRPPRIRKEQSLERASRSIQEFVMETTTATQTDPLPDDMIIEEEVTQAKLVVAPSRSGSQILVSTERIPSPTCMPTPPVPPLPTSQRIHREMPSDPTYDTVSLKSPSPVRETENVEDRHLSAPHLEETMRNDEIHARAIRAALAADETLRIGSLEVGDLRVDRLSVSQIEAQKIVASEVDALVITASELKNMGSALEDNLSPAIIKELIAIRSHLESVAASHAEEARLASARAIKAQTKTDIPITDIQTIQEESQHEEATSSSTADQPIFTEDKKPESNEDQKVVKREVINVKDQKIPTTHTLSIAQVDIKDKEIPIAHTLSVAQIELKDSENPTHSITDVQSTQDKSLRILDSESLLSLSSKTTKESRMEDSRASLPPSLSASRESLDSRISPERVAESISDVQQDASDSANPAPESSSPPAIQSDEKEMSPECPEKRTRKSRSRSPSPSGVTRQIASPVKSLPPVISVTPDTPDSVTGYGFSSDVQPQRAIISYSSDVEQSERESQRELSQSPIPSFPPGGTHLIAFPASQIPAQFFSMTGQTSQIDSDPSITDSMRQLLRAIRLIGVNAMRYFVGYLSSTVSGEESREKIREVELTLCALLLLVAGLLIFFFSSTRTVTHHHHWDYFNPPQ